MPEHSQSFIRRVTPRGRHAKLITAGVLTVGVLGGGALLAGPASAATSFQKTAINRDFGTAVSLAEGAAFGKCTDAGYQNNRVTNTNTVALTSGDTMATVEVTCG